MMDYYFEETYKNKSLRLKKTANNWYDRKLVINVYVGKNYMYIYYRIIYETGKNPNSRIIS